MTSPADAAAPPVSTVAEVGQHVVAEGLGEHGIDQGGRRLAAGSVGESDDLVEEARPPAAESVDPVVDLVFSAPMSVYAIIHLWDRIVNPLGRNH